MQIELAPEVENALVAEAQALGITPTENTVRILKEHSLALQQRLPGHNSRFQTIDDAVAWVESRVREGSPEIKDWRALAHEGHRYY